jgi:hypothetical protein
MAFPTLWYSPPICGLFSGAVKDTANRNHGVRGRVALVLCLASALAAAGCASAPGAGGSLKVKKIAAVAQPPGNVAAYFTVYTKEGKPLHDLDTPNFKVYENNKLVSEKKAKRALLETKPVEADYVLVLLDVSGPYVDGEDFPDIVTGIGRLIGVVDKIGQAAVSVFDGEDEIVPMLGFGASNEKAALESIRHFRPRNRNGNLNGAIVQGIDVLEKQLSSATLPFRYATLLVITDRGDIAKKVTAQAVQKKVANTDVDVQIIAIGPKVNVAELTPLASPGGLFTSPDPKDFSKGLTGTAKKLDEVANARYLFSYCTPKREGKHTLTLVIETPDDHGRLMYKFEADGFRNGCAAKHRRSSRSLPGARRTRKRSRRGRAAAHSSDSIPLEPKATSSMRGPPATGSATTTPDSGTEGWAHSRLGDRHGPQGTGVRVFQQPMKCPPGTRASSFCWPSNETASRSSTCRYCSRTAGSDGSGSVGAPLPFRTRRARISMPEGSRPPSMKTCIFATSRPR